MISSINLYFSISSKNGRNRTLELPIPDVTLKGERSESPKSQTPPPQLTQEVPAVIAPAAGIATPQFTSTGPDVMMIEEDSMPAEEVPVNVFLCDIVFSRIFSSGCPCYLVSTVH